MRSLKLRRPSPALIVSILALVVATSGVAVAANPFGSDGVIHACFSQQQLDDGGSTIVIVKSPEDCSIDGSDYPDHFTFNARGPQGVQGAQGPAGVPGAPGPAGQNAAAPPTLPPTEAAKLVKKGDETEKKLDKGADKLDKLAAKLGGKKPPKPNQIEQITQQITNMFASLLSAQQQQQKALGAVSAGIGVSQAQQKLKDAEEASKKAEEAQQKLEQADSQKEMQRHLDEMIKQIIAFMKELQEAQANQMQALARL